MISRSTPQSAAGGEQGLWHRVVSCYIRQRKESLVGWCISVVFHTLLLGSFVYLTWTRPEISGMGGTEVGIFYLEKGQTIEPGSEGTDRLDLAPTELPLSTLENRIDSEDPFTEDPLDVTLLETPVQLDAIRLIEMDAGQDSSLLGSEEALLEGGATARGGTASFFGLEAKGTRFVYVVDYSGSMTGLKLQAAKNELIRSVQSLTANMEFFIIFYDNQFRRMPGGEMVRATAQNKRRFLYWAKHIQGGGGTIPGPAMAYALSLKPDAVWLLSDGLFKGQDVPGQIRQMNPGGRVQIHTIAFYDNSGEAQLRQIAAENRGRFRFVRGPVLRRSP